MRLQRGMSHCPGSHAADTLKQYPMYYMQASMTARVVSAEMGTLLGVQTLRYQSSATRRTLLNAGKYHECGPVGCSSHCSHRRSCLAMKSGFWGGPPVPLILLIDMQSLLLCVPIGFIIRKLGWGTSHIGR